MFHDCANFSVVAFGETKLPDLGEISSGTTAKIEDAPVDRTKDRRCLVCEEIFLAFPSVASLKSWK